MNDIPKFIVMILRQRWPVGCWFVFGGRVVISSPVCVYWTLWPSLIVYRKVVSLYWLRRGLHIEFYPPDAPR